MPHRRSSSNVVARFEELRPFSSKEEVDRYLDNERLECLLCGKKFAALGIHITKKHGVTAYAYKVKLHLPLSRKGLAGTMLSKVLSENSINRFKGLLSNEQLIRMVDARSRGRGRNNGGYNSMRMKERKPWIVGHKGLRSQSRKSLLEVIRAANIGDTMKVASIRAGLNPQTVGDAFRRYRDLKAAFHECVRDSHAQ